MSDLKNVLVTGGSRGIGYAIAEALLKTGEYKVFICGRGKAELDAAVTELSKHGSVSLVTLDLRDRKAVSDFAVGWKEPLYALINNAGTWKEERIDEPGKDYWDEIIDLNLNGLYFLTKGLYPKLTQPGRIINISSQLGTMGRAAFGAYSASKHAVIGLTECWAEELGARGITANAVSPGWVRTKSNIDEIEAWAKEEGVTFEDKLKELSEPLLLKRFIEPAEVGNLVTFLVSEKASGITGKNYEIK